MSFTRLRTEKQKSKSKGSILGYKPFNKHACTQIHESGSNLFKYSEKLLEVQKLTETEQYTLQTYKEQAAR